MSHACVQANCPIAAPSANRYGHVSPTTAQHVALDMADYPVLVLDGGATTVGIESAVMRLSVDGTSCALLRRGGVCEAELARFLGEMRPPVKLTTPDPAFSVAASEVRRMCP